MATDATLWSEMLRRKAALGQHSTGPVPTPGRKDRARPPHPGTRRKGFTQGTGKPRAANRTFRPHSCTVLCSRRRGVLPFQKCQRNPKAENKNDATSMQGQSSLCQGPGATLRPPNPGGRGQATRTLSVPGRHRRAGADLREWMRLNSGSS